MRNVECVMTNEKNPTFHTPHITLHIKKAESLRLAEAFCFLRSVSDAITLLRELP